MDKRMPGSLRSTNIHKTLPNGDGRNGDTCHWSRSSAIVYPDLRDIWERISSGSMGQGGEEKLPMRYASRPVTQILRSVDSEGQHDPGLHFWTTPIHKPNTWLKEPWQPSLLASCRKAPTRTACVAGPKQMSKYCMMCDRASAHLCDEQCPDMAQDNRPPTTASGFLVLPESQVS